MAVCLWGACKRVTALRNPFLPKIYCDAPPISSTPIHFSNVESEPTCYLDYQATTPVDPRVLMKMIPFFVDRFANPHSKTHALGRGVMADVDEARHCISHLIGAQPKEIIFTSGATESNNLAIKGAAKFYSKNSKKRHIITTQIEHKCVLASCQALEEEGFDVTYLPVNPDGIVDLDELKAAIRPETILVSIMAVNNEIGVVQPLKAIGRICKNNGVNDEVLFHTDGAQAVGKIPIDVKDANIDLMSVSAHKMYGPKGVGCLYVRSKKPRVRLSPIISGGGQERGLRSGTLPAPLIVGFGEAARISEDEMERDRIHVTSLSERLRKRIQDGLPLVELNGSNVQRYHGNVNLSFYYVEGESLLMALPDFALSSGSACTSASLEPSYVLRALGVEEDLAHTSIRFGIGRFTTEAEVDKCADSVIDAVKKLREMSPLAEEGAEIKWT